MKARPKTRIVDSPAFDALGILLWLSLEYFAHINSNNTNIYTDWVLEQQEIDADFWKKIFFSDVTHYHFKQG